jgi:hypothetical protein
LAQAGSAATYGMMSHIPLRGMVKQRVLDMFASLYQAGGAEMDLHHSAQAAGQSTSLVDRIALWYVTRKQRSKS